MEKASFYALELNVINAEIDRLIRLKHKIQSQLEKEKNLELFPITADECRAKIRNILDNKTK